MSLAASLIPSASRPLALRVRPDLDAHEQVYEGRRYWVVKDPLTLRYYRFQEEEYAILSALDGRISLNDLRKDFERQFAPQKITAAELHHFLGTLYKAALVISDAAGQGEQLQAREVERRAQQRRERWGNLLAIRFRGFNPDRLLTWLNARVGWLFTAPMVVLAIVFGLSALLLLFVEFETFRARLPGFHEFFAWKNWIWLSLTLAVVKILHEFGHGLACKRLGGECHEMGVLLLILSPCLYANVSDAWTLPNKWHRAAIGAAGMYVELMLASLATYVWWMTQPGMVHYLALNVMFVCSVSTLMFNANPLMRFDGYYILSDLLEIPNLRTKANRVLQTQLGAWCLGLKVPHDPFLPRRNQLAFALFAVAAGLYGWLITVSILWTLVKMFEPYGFKVIGMGLAITMLYAVIMRPVMQITKFLFVPGRAEPVNVLRAMVSGSVVAAAGIALAWMPLPRYVMCSALVEPRDAASVYVDVAGNVREVLAQPFGHVEPGQPILRLENIDLDLALARLEGERAQIATRLEAMRERALVDDDAAQRVADTEEALAALDEQLARKHIERQRLLIVAPAAGILTPPAPRASEERTSGRLAVWNGHPLEVRNVGAHLPTGTVVGTIGVPDALEVTLTIDETEVDFVRVGQQVDIVLDELPGKRLTAQVATLSADELKIASSSLSQKTGGSLETRTDRDGQERPVRTTYQASAPLENPQGQIVAGARGTARIAAGKETLGRRLWREACRTLAWEL